MPKQTTTKTITYTPDEVRAILAAHLCAATGNRLNPVAADVKLNVKDRVAGDYYSHEPDVPAAFTGATITIETED